MLHLLIGGGEYAEKVTLKDEKIIDRWPMIIENGHGKAEQIYQDTQNFIKELKAPGIEIDQVRVKPSWLKGLLGRFGVSPGIHENLFNSSRITLSSMLSCLFLISPEKEWFTMGTNPYVFQKIKLD
jgi:hypothetical protein